MKNATGDVSAGSVSTLVDAVVRNLSGVRRVPARHAESRQRRQQPLPHHQLQRLHGRASRSTGGKTAVCVELDEVERRHCSLRSPSTINSSVNFIIYCLVGRRFRDVMVRVMCLAARRSRCDGEGDVSRPETVAAADASQFSALDRRALAH